DCPELLPSLSGSWTRTTSRPGPGDGYLPKAKHRIIEPRRWHWHGATARRSAGDAARIGSAQGSDIRVTHPAFADLDGVDVAFGALVVFVAKELEFRRQREPRIQSVAIARHRRRVLEAIDILAHHPRRGRQIHCVHDTRP